MSIFAFVISAVQVVYAAFLHMGGNDHGCICWTLSGVYTVLVAIFLKEKP